MRSLSTFIAAVAAVVSLAVQAQEPPARAGRLAYTEGSVSVYMDPELGWEPGYVNTPLTSENSVWTDLDSRAELRVSGIALRLDETTQLDISGLGDDYLDSTLVRGALNVRVRHHLPNGRIAFDTPNARFVILGDGSYRIDSDPDRGDSRLTVFNGRAALDTAGHLVPVPVGESVVVWGEGRASYAMQRLITTPFDRWAATRDARWTERRATQYVSTYMTGYEDLDQYGSWTQEPDYGPLWVPSRVESDWVPYRYGHWAWVRPWGWTWIDDQPWGYAPFHYGRWVYVRDRWAWYPGHRIERPVYAPALVAWVGGSGFNVAVSGGGPAVGWYPLSPFERYQPWYRANTASINVINNNYMINDRDRAGRYAQSQRDFTHTRAATVVPREAMLMRRPVQQAVVHVAPEEFRRQPVITQPTTVLPSRADAVRARAAAPTQATQSTKPAPSAASMARPGTPAAANAPGVAPAAPVVAPPQQRPSFARPESKPAPQAATPGATPPPPQAVTRAAPGQDRAQQEKGARDAQQRGQQEQQQRGQQEQAARDAQQRAQQEQQQRAQQEQQRGQQEKAARDAQQRGQQEQAARDAQHRAQQEQQRAQQEQQQRAQQEQQRGQQEKAARDAQQRAQQEQQQRAQQEQQKAQQEQQRAQQEKAARDAQQRAQQEQQQRAQQEQQRAQQEKAARDAQQRAQQEQQQRAQQEQQRAQQEKAARDAQQRAQPPQGQPPPPPSREKPKTEEEKKREESEKGSGR
jgi:hypothetical protein